MSILIAARNEAHTISHCLRAITELRYPAQALDVLVGNDQSTDQTASVVREFIRVNPGFSLRLIDIVQPEPGNDGSASDSPNQLVGKVNVLAQLARQARGQILFFTDADTRVPADWVTVMRLWFRNGVGFVTGVTLPEGKGMFATLQTIDWLYNLTLTHWLSHWGIPVTAMGNNMAVSRDAYEAVGGYPSLPFSIVEDYTLFRAVVGAGYGFVNLLDTSVLARTQPVDTIGQLLNQRKRWMRGAMNLPVWMVIGLYGQYLAGPLCLLLGLFMPALAIGLYLTRLTGQTITILFGLGRIRQTNLWPYAFLFELYQLIIGPLAVVYYWLPTRIEWKGRQY